MSAPREIPTVADYAHHGEEAAAVWYEENRYDMMYGGEPEYDPDPYGEYALDPDDPDDGAAYPDERVYTGGWERCGTRS